MKRTYRSSAMLAAVSGLFFASTPQLSAAQTKMGAPSNITIVDNRGRAIALNKLGDADRSALAEIQKSTDSLRQNARFTVTIHCTYPPLRCTITVTARKLSAT